MKKLYFGIGVGVSIISITGMFGCSESKSAQCQQIYAIAHDLVQETQDLTKNADQNFSNLDSWLQAAATIDRLAKDMESLKLEDPQLVTYKADWVKVQRTNARSTKEMVKAWQDRDLTAAELAKNKAIEAGELEQQIVGEINRYCQPK
jgi:hypothetical protein